MRNPFPTRVVALAAWRRLRGAMSRPLHSYRAGPETKLVAIRHLLAQLPCWRIRNCGFTNKANCPVISDLSKPCWANHAACPVVCSKDCYFCEVYRSAPNCESFKALLGTATAETPAGQVAAD